MPIYEYYCPSCRQRFEKMRPISQATVAATCEKGHEAERAISAFALGKAGGVQMMEMHAGDGGGGCCGGGGCACSN